MKYKVYVIFQVEEFAVFETDDAEEAKRRARLEIATATPAERKRMTVEVRYNETDFDYETIDF